MVSICGICEKKRHQDEKCFEKTEMADKLSDNWVSCLTEGKRKELGLSSIYCQEIYNNNDGSDNKQDTFGLVGAEFYSMAVCRRMEEEKPCQLEKDIITGTVNAQRIIIYYRMIMRLCLIPTQQSKTGAVNLCRQEGVSTMISNGIMVEQLEVWDLPVEK